MCKIFHNPKNLPFTRSDLEEAYLCNHDGTGLYYYNKRLGKSIVKKGEPDVPFETIWATVSKLHFSKNISNVAIHFRYGTSGGKGYMQTHPIKMMNDIHLMHNGVVFEFEGDRKLLSDTQCIGFGMDNLMDKMNGTEVSKLSSISAELNTRFAGNKLLFLQKDKYFYVNEDLGEGKDGIGRSFKSYNPSNYGGENLPESDEFKQFIEDCNNHEEGKCQVYFNGKLVKS